MRTCPLVGNLYYIEQQETGNHLMVFNLNDLPQAQNTY